MARSWGGEWGRSADTARWKIDEAGQLSRWETHLLHKRWLFCFWTRLLLVTLDWSVLESVHKRVNNDGATGIAPERLLVEGLKFQNWKSPNWDGEQHHMKTITDNLVSTKASIRLRFATSAAVGVKTCVIEEGWLSNNTQRKRFLFQLEDCVPAH